MNNNDLLNTPLPSAINGLCSKVEPICTGAVRILSALGPFAFIFNVKNLGYMTEYPAVYTQVHTTSPHKEDDDAPLSNTI